MRTEWRTESRTPWQTRWKTELALVLCSSLIVPFLAQGAQASVVRITAINDAYSATHGTAIDVHPGDVVTFSADILDESGQSQGASVEDFIWYANDKRGDVCNASTATDCLTTSNFQVTDYGVSFYTPYVMGTQIIINVTNTTSTAGDTVVLRNVDAQTGYVPPTEVVTDPSQYTGATLDPDYALAGQGRWVVISGSRFWAPYTYIANGDEEWAPYRNGYWSYDQERGHTWNSYDPWGWMTDHYGIWRQHGVYGWVWSPFDDLHYEPHTVSWFNDDQEAYVGWYPYFPGFARGYLLGAEYGFIDGYWNGYDCARGFGVAGYGFRPGYTVVRYGAFTNQNIVSVYERGIYENELVIGIVNRSYEGNRFARFPGQAVDFDGGRRYLETRCGVVPVGQVEQFGAGRNFIAPRPIYSVPDVYHQVAGINGFQRNTPIGSVIDGREVTPGHGPQFIPPTTNGRGVVAPPRTFDPQGHGQPMPPQAQRPAQPNQGNPIWGHQGPQPVYNPGPRPQPGPVNPGPRPQPGPEPVRPQPQPEPVRPQPQPEPVRPQPQPEPVRPQPQPEPVRPQPQPMPQPAPRPQPMPQPAPRPQPMPQPAPRPQPMPQPAPRPQPMPQPAPRPQPMPQPAPRPQPMPQPAPRPQPMPQPAPRPQPMPQPAPRPQPQPQPAPRPQPQPQPAPRPGPHHDQQ